MTVCPHQTVELRTAAGEWWCCDCGEQVPRHELPLLARTLKTRSDTKTKVTT